MSQVSGESALLVPVAECEPAIAHYRGQYDPSARAGIPAHVTLLFPFLGAAEALRSISELEQMLTPFPSFRFSLTELRRFPATLYLHPDRGERFVAITESLVRRWPQCPPYQGAYPDIVPHVTIADKVGAEVLDPIESALRGALPIHCMAREAVLWVSDPVGKWAPARVFPFKG